VIRIAISKAAFDAIAATIPPGSYESETNAANERLIWLPAAVVDRLKALRGPGESFSGWRRRTQGTRARSPLISAGTSRPSRSGTHMSINATRLATLNVAASAAILSMR
jgi:hypothetical protein